MAMRRVFPAIGGSTFAPRPRWSYIITCRAESGTIRKVGKVDKPDPKDIAMHVVVDGKARSVTFQELTLSNNLAQESLVRLLVKKKLIDPRELLKEMEAVRKERYVGPGDDKKAGS